MAFVNVEIKARCADHASIREVLRSQGARFAGEDHQVDTYFAVPKGRMKLREGNIENALIFYDRADRSGPKRSDVWLYRMEPDPALKVLLTAALGVRVVVDKRREIYFVDNVKVHLDRVAGLGAFVEIEAIDEDGSIGEAALQAQCEAFLRLFRIAPRDLVAHSYSDLLLGA
ncbi:class IV adenylate cyclase [Rhodocaloribacter sp.]